MFFLFVCFLMIFVLERNITSLFSKKVSTYSKVKKTQWMPTYPLPGFNNSQTFALPASCALVICLKYFKANLRHLLISSLPSFPGITATTWLSRHTWTGFLCLIYFEFLSQTGFYSYPLFSESRAEQGSRVAFGCSVSRSFTLEHSLLFIFHAIDLLAVFTTVPQEVPLSEFVSLLTYSVI